MASVRIVVATTSRIAGEAIAGILRHSLPAEMIVCNSWAQLLKVANNEIPADLAIVEDALVPESSVSMGLRLLSRSPVVLIDRQTSLARLMRHVHSIAKLEIGDQSEAGHKDYLQALTPRERDIFQLIVEGLSNKQIATKIIITQRTVKFHVSNILRKLKTQSRTQAVSLYLRSVRKGTDYAGFSDIASAPMTAAARSDKLLEPML